MDIAAEVKKNGGDRLAALQVKGTLSLDWDEMRQHKDLQVACDTIRGESPEAATFRSSLADR